MSSDIFEIMENFDGVMESVEYEPFGMLYVSEALGDSLDDIDKYDLTNEQDIKKIRSNINKMNNVKIALTVWSKLSSLAVAGSVVAAVGSFGGAVGNVVSNVNTTDLISGAINGASMGDIVSRNAGDMSSMTNTVKLATIIGLLSLITGKVAKLIAKSIAKGNEEELIYISKSLDNTISGLQSKLGSAKGPTKVTIQKQLQNAETFKNKVDAQLQSIGNSRQDANTRALNRIGNAGYANAAATLTR